MKRASKKIPIDMLNEAAIISKTDLNGVITFVNDEFCRVSGYSHDEVLGRTHVILNSGIHPAEFFAAMWEILVQGGSWHSEICNRSKTGLLYWLNTSIFPILNKKNGYILSYISISFDITEKKRLESELQSQKIQYDSVIESTDGFWQLDKEEHIIEVSECYCNLSGYTESEMLSMTISDLETNDHKGDMKYQLNILNEIVTSKVFESMHQRKNGSQWFVEILISYHPNRNNFYVFLRDISKRKFNEREQAALQLQLNHLQKLEIVGRLTAGIAHDFNNILSCMLGYNELNKYVAQDLPDGDLKDDLQNNVKQIEMAGNRAADLIKKMLTYCRQHDTSKNYSAIELSEIVNKALMMLHELIPKTIAIEVDLLDNTFITIEETDFYQIIVNLFVNARDAMKGTKGTIKLSVSIIENPLRDCSSCHEEISGQFVEVKITDTGEGIDPVKLPRIFEPFFTTKEVGNGTGLGLSVVSGIIHKMNGHIIVDSELGKGTTFRLLFLEVTH